jgi:hypothetical protein
VEPEPANTISPSAVRICSGMGRLPPPTTSDSVDRKPRSETENGLPPEPPSARATETSPAGEPDAFPPADTRNPHPGALGSMSPGRPEVPWTKILVVEEPVWRSPCSQNAESVTVTGGAVPSGATASGTTTFVETVPVVVEQVKEPTASKRMSLSHRVAVTHSGEDTVNPQWHPPPPARAPAAASASAAASRIACRVFRSMAWVPPVGSFRG